MPSDLEDLQAAVKSLGYQMRKDAVSAIKSGKAWL